MKKQLNTRSIKLMEIFDSQLRDMLQKDLQEVQLSNKQSVAAFNKANKLMVA
ncbi:hypothetical protein GS399_18015 [Pedobacter sp. HMF7647]|uniref:Uncharacterized protein n=1 Tax=Hufsiella arboris TaxID=2695275 RepID=A0A7K1YE42_9SPHI|nr:hypothetical protein [Hufsiella arboris]MXV52873.1 hypothetical protein [Hufsiella arboris]